MEWPDNDGTITGESTLFTPSSILVRPRRNPFPPGLGGAAGYCPRVRKVYCNGHLSPYPACAGTLEYRPRRLMKKEPTESGQERGKPLLKRLVAGKPGARCPDHVRNCSGGAGRAHSQPHRIV